jgi:diguanylate cyclase (GGDEF)-like protein
VGPTVWIESARFDQKHLSLKSGVRVGPESARLEIRFSAPGFTAPDRMRFRYRLIGFESEWSDAGSARSASYTNLPPGKYRFRVRAANSDGVWNMEGAALDVEVCPHFYQTKWFYGLSVIVLLYGGRTIYALRMRYLLRRNHELNERVAVRTAELENAMKAAESAREALREQATRDGLTGLWNRTMIFEILETELARHARECAPLSVLMADLDRFKWVNDTYGHMAGDEVLREATRRIRALMRPYDSAGRYGGEELMIVLSNCSLIEAKRRAEELRLAINGKPFEVEGSPIPLTCSFGVACSLDNEGSGRLVSAADCALYRAKSEGRDRVEVDRTGNAVQTSSAMNNLSRPQAVLG